MKQAAQDSEFVKWLCALPGMPREVTGIDIRIRLGEPVHMTVSYWVDLPAPTQEETKHFTVHEES